MNRVIASLGVALLVGGSPVFGQSAKAAVQPVSPKSATPVPADAPMFGRQGLWFSAGLGAGSTRIHCQICEGELGSRGTAGYARMGTTVNGRLLVGAELNGWQRGSEAGNQRVLALTGNGYWYPNPRHGYYFKGGLGLARYKQWATDKNNDKLSTGIATGGLTAQVGTGYEVRVNPRMSFVPYLNLVGTAQGTLATERNDGTHFERNKLPNRANVLMLQLGLGVTWH